MRNLSYAVLPPLSLPMRYFLAAMAYLVVFALLGMTTDAIDWQNRWHPALIALTHCFVLGVVSNCIFGALLQFLPVASGVSLPLSRATIATSWLLWQLGVASLLLFFLQPNQNLATLSSFCLVAAVLSYGFQIKPILIHAAASITVTLVRLASTAFAITIVLGILLKWGWLGFALAPAQTWTTVHLAWGILGFIALFIIAVSELIVPLFFVTASLPRRLLEVALAAIIGGLVVAIALTLNNQSPLLAITITFIALATLMMTTAKNLFKRKRQTRDYSAIFWYWATLSLLMSAAVLIYYQWTITTKSSLLVLAGLLILFGFIMAVILAMLIKILPFLTFMHIQQQAIHSVQAASSMPHMHQLLTPRQISYLSLLYALSNLCILSLPWQILAPKWVFTFSLLFALYLASITLKLVYRYRIFLRQLEAI